MPNVLMLIRNYAPAFSGHAIYLQGLIPVLSRTGCRCEVLTGDFGRYATTESIDGVTVHRVRYRPKEWRADVRFALSVLCHIVRHRKRFDILHLNGHLDQYGLFTLVCKLLRKKTLMQMVLLGSDDPEAIKRSFRFASVRVWLLSFIDRYMYISRPIGDSCRRVGLPASKLRYIPQGVDNYRFTPVTSEEKRLLRDRLGIPQDKVVVSFVGAIVYRKGVDILVEAWKRVQQECRESRLLLIGPSEFGEDDTNSTELTSFVDRIRAIIRNESLDVRMVGRTDQVPAFLQASDIFVLPSRKEGFGNVILEAMSCGVVPVVADMDGVSRETVVPGKTGYVFETRDQLVEILVRLIRNKDERGAFGGRAREDVLRRFTLEKIAEQYRAVYEEM